MCVGTRSVGQAESDFTINRLIKKAPDQGRQVQDAVSGWADPKFGRSDNPILTKGETDYAHHIATCSPGF